MANDITDRAVSRRSVLKGMAVGGAAVGMGGTLGSVLAACGGGSSSGPIKVGVLTDVTGAFGVVGKSNVETATFTINEINKASGVLGRQLEIHTADSASDTNTAATVARQLIEKDKVDVVIGTVTSATRKAVEGIIATTGKTLLIIPTSYEGGDCLDNMWIVGAVPNQQVDPMAKYALDKGAKTFYCCGADYLYPHNMIAEFKKQVTAAGGTVVGEDYYALTDTDISPLVTKALAAKADCIFDVTILPLSVQFVKGVVGGGFKGIHMSPLYDEGVNSLFGPDVAGIISVQDFFSSGTHDDFTTAEMAAYKTAYPQGLFASSFNSPAWYRGIYMYKLAVEKAGSTDLAKVNAAFDSIALDKGFGGKSAMKAGTRHCTLPMVMGEMQADGSVKVVQDLGTIDPTGQCA
jgi:branched-chain amino acid transport system substrate-binding protein